MTKEELGLLYPIKLVPYNPDWAVIYKKEIKHLLHILGPKVALHFEHIGSTAIPAISAKPTIDILIEIPSNFDPDFIISKMNDNGYIHMKEQLRHLMFVKGYSPTGIAKLSFHIHMGPVSQDWLWDRVYFRDYLINNPTEASLYESLKKELALKYKNDREAYTDMKADYIKRITDLAKKVLQ